jgi:hypothetical protein
MGFIFNLMVLPRARVLSGKVLFMVYGLCSLAMVSSLCQHLSAAYQPSGPEITGPVIIAVVAYARFSFFAFDELSDLEASHGGRSYQRLLGVRNYSTPLL